MALALNLETDSGVVIEYVNIQTITVDFYNHVVECIINGFISHDARTEGKAYVMSQALRVQQESLGTTEDPTRTIMYDYLKTLPAFAQATDA